MKIRLKELETLSHSMGYKSGRELLKNLGYPELMDVLAENQNIGHELVKDLYNAFGRNVVYGIIDFEGGNIDEFTSKYIVIGNNII